jgi:hypothetical protein
LKPLEGEKRIYIPAPISRSYASTYSDNYREFVGEEACEVGGSCRKAGYYRVASNLKRHARFGSWKIGSGSGTEHDTTTTIGTVTSLQARSLTSARQCIALEYGRASFRAFSMGQASNCCPLVKCKGASEFQASLGRYPNSKICG